MHGLVDYPPSEPRQPDGGIGSLLNARSIAILGASDNAGNPAGRAISYNVQNGFSGAIYPVNPKYETVHGLTAYPTLHDLPDIADIAVVAIPGDQILPAIRGGRARNYIVFTDGFRETGEAGRLAEMAIAAEVRRQGARMLGPNCLGFVNRRLGLVASFMPAFAHLQRGSPSGVVAISQSGAIGSYFCMQAERAGLLVQEWVSTGNEADLTVCDLLEYYVDRPDVQVIVLQCEGLDPAHFSRLLDRLDETAKVLLVAKGGRTDVGAKASASHTGTIAGSDLAFDAMLRGHRVIRTQSTDELIHLASAASLSVLPRGRRIGIFSASGGAGILMADEATDLGLSLPAPPPAVKRAVAADLGEHAANNPLDLTARAIRSPALYATTLSAMADPSVYDSVACYLGGSTADPVARQWLFETIGRVRAETGMPMIACGGDVDGSSEALRRQGVPLFADGVTGIRTLAKLVDLNDLVERGEPRAATRCAPAVTGLDEFSLKRHFESHGLRVPAGSRASSVAALRETGIAFPVVLKLTAEGLVHKSDVGGVALNLTTVDDVLAAAERMAATADRHGMAAPGFIVERMIGPGIELIISVRRDSQYGLLLILGLGGIYTEILQDAAVEILPSSETRIEAALKTLRGWPLLAGARGCAALDVRELSSRILDIAVVLAGLLHDPTIAEIELNPVIARTDGLWIADAAHYRV